MTKLNKTIIIQHKETKEKWTASSGKSSWKAVGHAKNAWVGSCLPEEFKKNTGYSWKENMRFDEQDVYEIIELKPESDKQLQKARELLSESVGSLQQSGADSLVQEIREFLSGLDCDKR